MNPFVPIGVLLTIIGTLLLAGVFTTPGDQIVEGFSGGVLVGGGLWISAQGGRS